MVLLGIMRISWQFHGDILETSWEYDWAYHGSHGSRGNRITLSQGSEYPLSDQPVGVTTTTIYGGIPSFKTFLGNCLLLGLPQSVPFMTSVYGILPDFDNYHAPHAFNTIGQNYVGYWWVLSDCFMWYHIISYQNKVSHIASLKYHILLTPGVEP